MKVLLAIDGSPASLVTRDLVAGLHWPDLTTIHARDRLLLGSVARNVLTHAHCSVLVVRNAGASTSQGGSE